MCAEIKQQWENQSAKLRAITEERSQLHVDMEQFQHKLEKKIQKEISDCVSVYNLLS